MTHRCRPSCSAQVARDRAFCRRCWSLVPGRVQRAVYASWHAHGVSEEHARLLVEVAEALEGERTWAAIATDEL